MALRNAIDALASVLFPGSCRICGDSLWNASRIPVCPACLHSFECIADPVCDLCGRPFSSPVAAQASRPLCRLCRNDFYSFDRARTFAIYNDALASAILLLKYEQVTRLGDWFADRLIEIVAREPAEWIADVVVPVPLHPQRRRERGYNQADMIAGPFAKKMGIRLGSRLLVRTKPRPSQLVLSRTDHWKSVRGAYATNAGTRVDNLRVLLVDDMFTTGATLDACARALKHAGAASVVGLTVGRVVPGWPNQRPRVPAAIGHPVKPFIGSEHH